MSKYDYRYTTAFPLITKFKNETGHYIERPLTPRESKDFLHKRFFSYIKKKILVYDRHKKSRRGIPFYAYYVISKKESDIHYHAHVLFNIHEHYSEHVISYIEFFIGGKVLRLETKEDTKRMIWYMLRRGNLVIDSDNEYLLPTGYNLWVDKRHFAF
jgi:hypothetical protein